MTLDMTKGTAVEWGWLWPCKLSAGCLGQLSYFCRRNLFLETPRGFCCQWLHVAWNLPYPKFQAIVPQTSRLVCLRLWSTLCAGGGWGVRLMMTGSADLTHAARAAGHQDLTWTALGSMMKLVRVPMTCYQLKRFGRRLSTLCCGCLSWGLLRLFQNRLLQIDTSPYIEGRYTSEE